MESGAIDWNAARSRYVRIWTYERGDTFDERSCTGFTPIAAVFLGGREPIRSMFLLPKSCYSRPML